MLKILLLVFKAMGFFSFLLFSLGMNWSLKTNIQRWDQMTFEFNISADNLNKLFEKFELEGDLTLFVSL